MAKPTENLANLPNNQEFTLTVKLLRFTVINERFVLASVGWLASYRELLPQSPQAYVFPSSKNLAEGAEYSITGKLKAHKIYGLQFSVIHFKRLAGSRSASWINAMVQSSESTAKAEPPPYTADIDDMDSDTPTAVVQIESVAETSKYPEALAALLKGDVPTIGVETAKRLYNAFGDSLFEFTDGAPLVGLTGFGERRAFTAISNLRTYMYAINTKST